MVHREAGRTRRRRSVVAALLTLGLLTSACTTAEPDASPTSTTLPPADTVLQVSSARWPTCLHPLTCHDRAAVQLVLQHVVPVLMQPDPDGGFTPSPLLEGRPKVAVDEITGHQRIRYRIDPAARWHDGRAVTSTDVLATWEAIMATPGAPRRGYEHIIEVDDDDPLVAVVELDQAWSDWPQLFGGHDGWLLQADLLQASFDLTGRFDDGLGFGAGPFELVSFDADEIVLAARDDHWNPDQQAAIDLVRITRIDDETGVRVPRSADIVILERATLDVADRLERRTAPTTEVVGLLLDRRTTALQSGAVRRAIELVVDRTSILDLVTPFGLDAPELVGCVGFLPSEEACDPDTLPATPADLGSADATLNQDGWVRGADGGRSRSSDALALPVTFDPTLPRAGAIADAVRLSVAALGATTATEPLPFTGWSDPGRRTTSGISVQAVPLGTPGRLDGLYGCDVDVANPLAWCDDTVQDLLDTLLLTTDEDDAVATASAIGAIAAATPAWLPLYRRADPWLIAADRIEIPNRRPFGRGPLARLHDITRIDG